jgi:acyl carrier protein
LEIMETREIQERIKEIIAKVAGIDRRRIRDEAGLRDDLNLDSLSLLEIGVDVDLAFALNLPDEAYREAGTIPEMVALVGRRLAEMGEMGVGIESGPAGGARQPVGTAAP